MNRINLWVLGFVIFHRILTLRSEKSVSYEFNDRITHPGNIA